jgi:hypothetical protein
VRDAQLVLERSGLLEVPLPLWCSGCGQAKLGVRERGVERHAERSVFERRAPGSLAAVEAAMGNLGVRRGSTVREASDELLAALTAAYEEAATGQLTT